MKSSFSRTLFPAAVILLMTLLVVGTSFQILVRNYLNQTTLEDLEKDSQTISRLAAAYYTQPDFSPQEFVVNLSMAARIADADTVICNTDGQLVLCSNAPMGCSHQGLQIDRSFLDTVLRTGSVSSTGLIKNLYDESRYIAAVRIDDLVDGAPLGVVIVSTPTDQTNRILGKLSDIYVFVSVLVALIAGMTMAAMARRQARPLRELAQAASAFGHGKLDARVSVDRHSSKETQELALAFNNMAASLEKSEYQRQEFVANVSHELKTPMTVISGYVDGMLDGTIPEDRRDYYMDIVSREAKRLSRLVRSMLDISRLQDGDIPEEKKTRIDICETVGQVLITFEQKITGKRLNVTVNMPEFPVYTLVSADAITQVIYNLVDNGVKFCPPGQDLTLQVRTGSNKIYVSVANQGDTIPAEELDLVFDRFHKLDKARGSTQDGWGLGLYIVKQIVCAHGEDISVSSRDGVTEFTFTLPLVT